MDNSTRQLADLLLSSRSTVVLSGAGISTESGIPDFRSPDSGIYHIYNENVFSTVQFRDDPGVFYAFARAWLEKFGSCAPNDAHTTLAWLESKNLIHTVITQNIDGLHNRAGSKQVLEIHGHMREAFCTTCMEEYDFSVVSKQIIDEAQRIPFCPSCAGVLKPKVVFFGDMLPTDFQGALDAAAGADLFLVLGSSLLVAPASMLPSTAPGKLGIINLETTHMDGEADLVIRRPLGETMREVRAILEKS